MMSVVQFVRWCAVGSYCPATTALIPLTQPKPCAIGFYGARDGLTDASECTRCPAGMYCDAEGMLQSL